MNQRIYLEVVFVFIVTFNTTCAVHFLEKSDKHLTIQREVRRLSNFINHKVLEDPSEASIFYSINDNHAIKTMMPRPWIKAGQSLRLPFIGDPCSCTNTSCGCCVGINITSIHFDKQACINVTYDQSIFGIIVDVYVDHLNILHNVYSASNPPPVCIPLLISGVPTGIDFCLRLYQIYITGYNVHLCIDLEVRIISSPIIILHFDCVILGVDGVTFLKPNSTTSEKPTDEILSPTVDGDIFDPVMEHENSTLSTTINPNKMSMSFIILTPLNSNSNGTSVSVELSTETVTPVFAVMSESINYNQTLQPILDQYEVSTPQNFNENVSQFFENGTSSVDFQIINEMDTVSQIVQNESEIVENAQQDSESVIEISNINEVQQIIETDKAPETSHQTSDIVMKFDSGLEIGIDLDLNQENVANEEDGVYHSQLYEESIIIEDSAQIPNEVDDMLNLELKKTKRRH